MELTGESCPCESGKLMKDCCFSKKATTLERHWTTIKIRMLQTFVAIHPTNEEKEEIKNWVQIENLKTFTNQMDQLTANHLLADLYFFTKNREQWIFHLMQSMKEIIQPRAHTILTSWQKPYYFIGEIIGDFEEFLILRHIWTKEIIYLSDTEIEDKSPGDIILGHIIPGANEHFYNLLSSAIVVDYSQRNALDEWWYAFESSEFENLEDFYEEELLRCLITLMTEVPFIEEVEKPPNLDILKLIISLDMHLLNFKVSSDRLSFVFFNYIIQNGAFLKVRKQHALVAAAVDFGMKNDFITKVITQKKLSELFDISKATIANYSRKISLYYDEEFDTNMFDKIRQPQNRIGTDATEDEYKSWQLERHLEKMVFTNNFEQKRMEKKLASLIFRPIRAEDKAQKYAYEAYLSENKEKREELAKQAYMNDPTNIDANLLLHEGDNLEQRLEILNNKSYYVRSSKSSIRLIYLQVTILYHLQRFDEALQLIETLSENEIYEHSILKYLHPLLQMLNGDLSGVSKIMLNEQEEQPMKSWLLWALSTCTGDILIDPIRMNAIQSNPFVQKYIELSIKPYEFPAKLSYSYGDPNEAKIIHFMIYPFLKDEI